MGRIGLGRAGEGRAGTGEDREGPEGTETVLDVNRAEKKGRREAPPPPSRGPEEQRPGPEGQRGEAAPGWGAEAHSERGLCEGNKNMIVALSGPNMCF